MPTKGARGKKYDRPSLDRELGELSTEVKLLRRGLDKEREESRWSRYLWILILLGVADFLVGLAHIYLLLSAQ